jgi:hypothetical protein
MDVCERNRTEQRRRKDIYDNRVLSCSIFVEFHPYVPRHEKLVFVGDVQDAGAIVGCDIVGTCKADSGHYHASAHNL